MIQLNEVIARTSKNLKNKLTKTIDTMEDVALLNNMKITSNCGDLLLWAKSIKSCRQKKSASLDISGEADGQTKSLSECAM